MECGVTEGETVKPCARSDNKEVAKRRQTVRDCCRTQLVEQ